MNFTFIQHKYAPSIPQNRQNNEESKVLRPMNIVPRNPRAIILPEPKIEKIVVPEKKMTWGEPTWFFFHTLAEKIKPDKFLKIKRDLVNIIIMICNNLPCPVCSQHAVAFMNKVNFNTINTAKDLKMLFFKFHNEVNARKGYTLFTEEELNEKYPAAITNNVFANFIQVFERKNTSMRLMADSLHRARVMEVIKKWLANNRQHFMD